MADEVNPKTETVEAPPEAKSQDAPQVWEDGTPFDAARAKETILSLRGQEKTWKAEHTELEQLRADKQQRETAEMTDLQKAQKAAAEATAQAAKLQADLLRRDVIAETGLPALFADRLQGATKEEMLADAQKLAAALPKSEKKPPQLPPTDPGKTDVAETDAQKRERLFGKQGNPFDLDWIKSHGGGVSAIK